MGPEGKLLSAQQFLEILFGDLKGLVDTEDQLRTIWSHPDTRQRLTTQLAERGYAGEVLDKVKALVDASNSDLFDVLSYILFVLPPLTRETRADRVKADGLEDVSGEMRSFLRRILASYVDHGEQELTGERLGQHLMATYGGAGEGKEKLGEVSSIREAYLEMQGRLYESTG